MIPPASESLVFEQTPAPQRPPDVRLLHFNDVYHVDASSAEPVGGIARFQTLVNYYRHDGRFEGQPKLITIFSGDAFNPSLESSVTKGECLARGRKL
jgi:2',3'-cyclic-nucleotide 2'-phosphodiesterase (5'-nucleotidase family)